jgi:hypothetical protein
LGTAEALYWNNANNAKGRIIQLKKKKTERQEHWNVGLPSFQDTMGD